MTQFTEEEKAIRRIERRFSKGVVQYGLIEEGDKILIGLSGGKDSLALVELLGRRAHIYKPRFSAVAKGYSVDVVAQLLDRKGIKSYMVDIGGEVVVKGKNPSKGLWRIGINKPVDDSLAVNQDLQTILEISDLGLATSGNYRNYYYKDGKKYAHTIDPRTGYPVQHSILSSTVIAKDCMTADALATAFMVMGLEEAEAFCKANPEIDAYFIYSGENGEFNTFYTEGMKKYIAK